MVEPVEVELIALANHELITKLFIQVMLDLFFGGGIGGCSKRSFKCMLLLFFDKAADIIHREAL